MGQIKKMFGDTTMHIEAAKGDFEQNKKYCSKEGKYWEWGTPKTGGKNI